MKKHNHKLMVIIGVIAGTFAAASLTASAQNTSNDTAGKSGLSDKDKAFIKDAAHGGAMEVQMGKLGEEKATSGEVKVLAGRLVKDHTKANAELEKIVTSKGGEVPKSPSIMQDANLKLLGTKSGTSFDKSFAEDAVKDHQKDVAAFEKAAKELDDPELRAFAAKTVPTLKEHLSMAEKASEKLGK